MLEKRTPIPVDEAVRRVCHFQKQGETEWVALEDSLHRFLAEDITADHHVPAFDRSPYDGFAVRACDTAEASLIKMYPEVKKPYRGQYILEGEIESAESANE